MTAARIARRLVRKSYRITINGQRSYIAIGDRDALMDAAYDEGAEGVSIVEVSS
jgi:hypothetical protein